MSITKVTNSMIQGAVANILDYGADPTGITDATAIINTVIATGKAVFIPRGVYLVDPDIGILLKNGTVMFGEGRAASILVAKPNGGTIAELAAYTKGSVIKRAFSVAPATNAYISLVELRDFAVVMNHPTASVTSTAIQIGIDLRNITRSLVENVWVGNDAPINQTLYIKAATGVYAAQGYGIVLGNVSSSESSYCGGEVNIVRTCNVVGAYKNIILDDLTLSPLSSAHATVIDSCDIQGGHQLLCQEDSYNAGSCFVNNTVQNILVQPGNANPTFVLRMDGYNGVINSGYIEAGSNVNYLLYLGASSHNNVVRLSHYGSTTGTGYISDAGAKNSIQYFENTSVAPEVTSTGAPVYLYDGHYKLPYKSLWVKFHWNGSSVVIDGSSGNVSVLRTGVGDYTITYSKNFPTDSYAISTQLDTNASGHGGMTSVLSHSTSNMRLVTAAQNGAATTYIDPRFVWVQVSV